MGGRQRRCSWLKWICLIGVIIIVYKFWYSTKDSPTYSRREEPQIGSKVNWKFIRQIQINTSKPKKVEYHELPGPPLKQSETELAYPLRPNYGEDGQPVHLINLSWEQQNFLQEGWNQYKFNSFASDLISMKRKLPDKRHPGCLKEKYSPELPQVSVIIAFYNEARSTLLRTIHSILERSPPELLKEIILVDDFSELPHLQKQLEEYIVQFKKLRLIRTSKREGLIRARLLGSAEAKAPVLVFMDSHCECTTGWLKPLVQQIYNNWTKIVSPVIDTINEITFEYVWLQEVHVGGFNWDMTFEWHEPSKDELERRKNPWDPIRTPVIPGIFAVNKLFFQRIGSYDKELNIWGGENLELSFKAWMCGGSMDIVPCSHVGHVYRTNSPLIVDLAVLKRNYMRIAEVWMDDYKNYYYQTITQDSIDVGDISERVRLRKDLECNSFHWYLVFVYPEQFVPGDAISYGEIRNADNGNTSCLDSNSRDGNYNPIIVYPCHGGIGNQLWMMTESGAIRKLDKCLEFNQYLILSACRDSNSNQKWIYNASLHQIKHQNSGWCLQSNGDHQPVLIAPCNDDVSQIWQFQHSD